MGWRGRPVCSKHCVLRVVYRRLLTNLMASLNFFTELKRRNVYKVAVAYAVVAWLVIQVASIVLPTFHAPEWTLQVIIALVVIGFPVALVCSWAFEITP